MMRIGGVLVMLIAFVYFVHNMETGAYRRNRWISLVAGVLLYLIVRVIGFLFGGD